MCVFHMLFWSTLLEPKNCDPESHPRLALHATTPWAFAVPHGLEQGLNTPSTSWPSSATALSKPQALMKQFWIALHLHFCWTGFKETFGHSVVEACHNVGVQPHHTIGKVCACIIFTLDFLKMGNANSCSLPLAWCLGPPFKLPWN